MIEIEAVCLFAALPVCAVITMSVLPLQSVVAFTGEAVHTDDILLPVFCYCWLWSLMQWCSINEMCSCDRHYQIVSQYSEQNIKLFYKNWLSNRERGCKWMHAFLKFVLLHCFSHCIILFRWSKKYEKCESVSVFWEENKNKRTFAETVFSKMFSLNLIYCRFPKASSVHSIIYYLRGLQKLK